MAGEAVTVDELMGEIRRDTVFYDQSGGGVTFSGGEPLSQPGFLLECLARCKQEDISTAVDTSGYCSPDVLMASAQYADIFLYDLKLMDSARHLQYTGVDNDVILSNLKALATAHPGVHVRIPLIPGVNDDEENLNQTGKFLARAGRINSVTVLPYHKSGVGKYDRLSRAYALAEISDPSEDDLLRAVSLLSEHGLVVTC